MPSLSTAKAPGFALRQWRTVQPGDRLDRDAGPGARVREARAAGARRIGLHAQTDALGLYERAGFTPYGERFEEEGIEHLGMEKRLDA